MVEKDEELRQLIWLEATSIERELQGMFDDVKNTIDQRVGGLDVEINRPVNAKLYDLHGSDELMKHPNPDELFWEFAQNEWAKFEGFVHDSGADIEHVGSTSSFYIVPKGLARTEFDLDMLARLFDNVDYNELSEIAIGEPNPHYIGDVILPVEIYGTDVEAITAHEAYEPHEINEELYEQIKKAKEVVYEELEVGFDNLLFLFNEIQGVGESHKYLEDFKKNQVALFVEQYG